MIKFMECLPCCKEIVPNGKEQDCIEWALEKIKQHYFLYRKETEKKLQQISDLKERNEKLEEAVNILQEEQKQYQKQIDEQKLKENDKNKSNFADEISFNMTEVSPNCVSELNMAINSEQLLNASGFSISSTQNETIGETESLGNSPAKVKPTHSVWKKRREQIRSQNKPPEKPKEEEKPLKKTESWMGKERGASPVPRDGSLTAQNSTTLRDLINVKNEKKINLSLNKNKIRQKRLTFEKEKNIEKSQSDNPAEKVDEVIDSPIAGAKQSKPSRKLLARDESNESKANTTSKQNPVTIKNLKLTRTEKDSKIADDYIFDFNTTTVSVPFQAKSNVPIPDTSLDLKLNLTNKSGDSPSCVILTPATQDIIFIDDENDETNDDIGETSKHIQTLDLLSDIMKNDDESLTRLKRLESDGIRKQQRRAVEAKELSNPVTKTCSEVKKCPPKIKTEKVTQRQVGAEDSTFIDEAILEQNRPSTSKKREAEVDTEDEDLLQKAHSKIIKHERMSTLMGKHSDSEMYSEDDDDLFKIPLPMIVKTEKDVLKEKKSYKERFVIDCEDCEKYLEIVGDRLNDKEIEDILKKCAHRKERDLMRANTPDGFWNPLLLSFAEDDPRNEVLVDDRFVGKKRKS